VGLRTNGDTDPYGSTANDTDSDPYGSKSNTAGTLTCLSSGNQETCAF